MHQHGQPNARKQSMRRDGPRVLALALPFLIACAAFSWGPANAERKSVPSNATSTTPVEIPGAYQLNLLIRTTLIALNQANQTGNYTVLRDLAAPSFQRANTSAQLGEIFSILRKRNLDLSPIMFMEPKLIRPPKIDEAGMLRLSGFIPSEPEQVLFDMLFQQIDNRWQLFGLTVDVRPPAAASATAEPTPKGTPSPPQKKPPDTKNTNNSKEKK